MARTYLGVVAAIGLLSAGCTAPVEPAPVVTTPSIVAGAGSSGSPAPTPTDALAAAGYAALRRPWAHPAVPAGKPCPVTTTWTEPDPELGRMLGSGRARPVGLAAGAVLDFVGPGQPSQWVDRTWGGQKVLWAVDPAVVGPVLIRGRRLDGPGRLAFEDPAILELVLNTDDYEGRPGGWKDYPSSTRLRAPGCYAYQIDTGDGTWTVVFRARGPRV
jgi:hypothetical protein